VTAIRADCVLSPLLEYFDNCTAALFAKAGLSKREMLKTYGIVGFPLVECAAVSDTFAFSEDVV